MARHSGSWGIAVVTCAIAACTSSGGASGDHRVATGAVEPADVTTGADTATATPPFVLPQTEWPSCAVPGGWDCPCQANADCASGVCTWTAQGARCTVSCQETCPADFACRPVPGDSLQLACLWTFAPQCQGCASDADCGPGGASTVLQGHHCGPDHRCAWNCAKDGICPAGFSCQAVATDHDDLHLCQPQGGQCPAWTPTGL